MTPLTFTFLVADGGNGFSPAPGRGHRPDFRHSGPPGGKGGKGAIPDGRNDPTVQDPHGGSDAS